VSKILNVKAYSINVKVALSLSLLALFLITILFALIVPKIEDDKYNTTIREVEKVLSITEEQIKLAGKAIMMQSRLEVKANRYLIELELNNIIKNLDKKDSLKEIQNKINKSKIIDFVDYSITLNNKSYISKKEVIYSKYKFKEYEKWEYIKTTQIYKKEHVYNIKYYFYTKKIFNDLEITLFYEKGRLNKNHLKFEDTLKENLQNTFNLTQDLHKGKTYVFWLNSKYKDEEKIPLYVENIVKAEDKYTISKLSDVSNIYTGDLSAKKIMEIKNKSYIEHTVNNQTAISWIRDLYEDEYDGYILLLVKTVYKEDLIKRIDSSILTILPSAIISLALALIIGYFIFKRLFKGINILTNIAKEVNSGNKSIRSNVLGNDDIGTLGVAFDSMLDSFENNIKNLDLIVEEKTQRIQSSLKEKDVLLKEIHHRVKNNLALTISLIKLQQEEIGDTKAQKALIDIQERIYTMELLHRKLYESPNLNQINFKEYIINLINNISIAYMNKEDFKIHTKIDDIYLSIEKSMPCGLILNEIITNAFKYAFKDNINPYLSVNMKKEEGFYILIVKDNGKGIKEDIDIYNSNTLGLKLINSISKLQLRGKLEYKYEEGSEFKVIFK
jgi:two-component sensor histidine kinase